MMKHFVSLLLPAISYTLVVLIGVASFCLNYKCELVGGELILMEWLIPGVIVTFGLFVVGLGVAYINFYIAIHKQGILKSSILQFVLGSVAGVLPLLFWNIVIGSFTWNYRPSLQEVPFLLGGIVVATLIRRINPRKADEINGVTH